MNARGSASKTRAKKRLRRTVSTFLSLSTRRERERWRQPQCTVTVAWRDAPPERSKVVRVALDRANKHSQQGRHIVLCAGGERGSAQLSSGR